MHVYFSFLRCRPDKSQTQNAARVTGVFFAHGKEPFVLENARQFWPQAAFRFPDAAWGRNSEKNKAKKSP